MDFKNTVVRVELTNENAMERLLELETLHFIKVKKSVKPIVQKQKLSDKFKGILTKEQGISLDNHIEKIRGEWDRI